MSESTPAYITAASRWSELDGQRQSFMLRCEKYAAFTLPKLCLPNGYNQNSQELQHDYQSLGAQGVNHASNKLMLALFAPSRPFFRLDPGTQAKEQLKKMNLSEDQLAQLLSVSEKNAVKIMDQRAIRPKLHEAVKHLIVTGNALLVLDKKVRTLGLKKYCVKRAPDGTVLEILTKEPASYLSLDRETAALVARTRACDHNTTVIRYRWIRRALDGRYRMSQWIDDIKLPSNYDSVWTEDKLPYRAITWDLADGDDYGSGLVEDYAGDFASLSMMSEATVQAALLASEFRWLCNPSGMTKADDLMKSRNGAALPGVNGDITIVTSGKQADLQTNLAIAQEYIRRIGAGFLLNSAVTRDAERVTAEEIRMTAEELETSWGGAYSRIAVDVQTPLARWLMKQAKQDLGNSDIEISVVTGMDALSRSGDRDNLVLFLNDLGSIGSLPPDVRARLQLTPIISTLASARGIAAGQYIKTEEQVAQESAAQREQALKEQATVANIEAQAKGQVSA